MVNLSPPWNTYQRILKAIFEEDKEVNVSDLSGEGKDCNITIKVDNDEKAYALKVLLNPAVVMGNIGITIVVLNKEGLEPIPIDAVPSLLIDLAFKGNPIFVEQQEMLFFGGYYCIMAKKILQFFNDDLSDYKGNYNELAARAVGDVCVHNIGDTLINYCTFAED